MSKSWLRSKDKKSRPKDVVTISGSPSEGSTSSGWAQTRDTAIPILELIANISEGSDVLALLKAACKATKQTLEVARSIQNNKDDWGYLAKRLNGHLESMESQITIFESYPEEDRKVDDSLRQPLLAYVRKLDEIQREVETRTRSRLLSRATKVDIDAGDIRQFHQDVDDCYQRLTAALAVSSALHIQAVKRNTEILKENTQETKQVTKTLLNDADVIVISQLPIVLSTLFTVHDKCKLGTRLAVLDIIRRWGEGEFPEPIFWLCDIAGSGKSTVSTSMVAIWKEAGLLGGQFFFSMVNSEESTTAKVCTTLARQLVENTPTLAAHVADAIKRHPAIITNSIEEQFRKLIVEPAKHHDKVVILVIDALDECRVRKEREQFLGGLSAAIQGSPNLKVFLTSRPEPDIEKVLGALALKKKLEFRLYDPIYPDNVDDVAAYIHETLQDDLSPDQRLNLIQKANGLFIWAKTVCQMFDPDERIETPHEIYQKVISINKPSNIDSVYGLVLDRIDPNVRQTADSLLAILITAFEPLAHTSLDKIMGELGLRVDTTNLLKRLSSVLHVDQATTLIRFRHPTFFEYLVRHFRAGENVRNLKAHGALAGWSLKTMEAKLKFNICQLGSSFVRNKDVKDFEDRATTLVPPDLRYASSHWLFHLSEADEASRQKLLSQIEYALRSPQVLYWIEVLSVTLRVPRAIASLRRAIPYFRDEINDRMVDIRRFLMAYSIPIQESIPHIYISALPFTPVDSILRIESMEWFPRTLSVVRGLDAAYPGLPTELRGHYQKISTLIFSPDGSRVIAGVADRSIRLWDVETGHEIGKPLRGHTDVVACTAVSLDGSRLVSGGKDRAIRLWDVDRSSAIGEPLLGHRSWVSAVSISPDSLYIVSGGWDWTVRLWDVERMEAVGEPFQGHSDAVTAVDFFSDGSRVVSGSKDTTIRLWDVKTLQPAVVLRGHSEGVTSVWFSPNGLQIISASSDITVRIWDSQTGDLLRDWSPMVMGLFGQAIAPSSDGSLALLINGPAMFLFDTASNEILGLENGDIRDPQFIIAMSPTDKYGICGSEQGVIQLWDASNSRPSKRMYRDRKASIMSVASSSDGSTIASCSTDATISLWDTKTGKERGSPLRGHIGAVYSAVFSPDDSMLVSGGEDKTVRMWNAGTHEASGDPCYGHTDAVRSVRFSHSGLQIVSGSADGTVFLWDVGRGAEKQLGSKSDTSGVLSALFSADDLRVVALYDNRTILMWDASTGAVLNRFEDMELKMLTRHWALSPDGLRFAAGGTTDDNPIYVLDIATGEETMALLHGPSSEISCITFSPDGLVLICGLEDGSIWVCDAATGQYLGKLLGHTAEIREVAYSADGTRLVSNSDGLTIRVWDTSSYRPGTTPEEVQARQNVQTPSDSAIPVSLPDLQVERTVLSEDGWVESNGRLLFWVPPNNRHGLRYPCILNIPTTSHQRTTEYDFTNFLYDISWTNVQRDAA